MKIYVDKLPKSCMTCPCFHFGGDFSCGLDNGCNDYFRDEIDGGVCPLESIADHDKQVRAELLEETKSALREKVVKMQCDTYSYPQNAVCWEDLVTVLKRLLEKKGNRNDSPT